MIDNSTSFTSIRIALSGLLIIGIGVLIVERPTV
jgi:hypothetical protein